MHPKKKWSWLHLRKSLDFRCINKGRTVLIIRNSVGANDMWTGSGWVYFFKLQAWFYCRIWPNSHHWGICPGSPTGQVGWLIQAYCPGFAKEQVELRILFTLAIIACPWLAAGEKPVQCLVGARQSSWQEVKSCVLKPGECQAVWRLLPAHVPVGIRLCAGASAAITYWVQALWNVLLCSQLVCYWVTGSFQAVLENCFSCGQKK